LTPKKPTDLQKMQPNFLKAKFCHSNVYKHGLTKLFYVNTTALVSENNGHVRYDDITLILSTKDTGNPVPTNLVTSDKCTIDDIEYKFCWSGIFCDESSYITVYPKDYVFVTFSVPHREEYFPQKTNNDDMEIDFSDDNCVLKDFDSKVAVPKGTKLIDILEEEQCSNELNMAKWFKLSEPYMIHTDFSKMTMITKPEDLDLSVSQNCLITVCTKNTFDEEMDNY